VVLKTGLDAVAKRKIPSPFREWNPDHPTRSLVTIVTELSRLLIIFGDEYKLRSFTTSILFILLFLSLRFKHFPRHSVPELQTKFHTHTKASIIIGLYMGAYPKVSGLAAWNENYSSLPLGAVVSLFYGSV
jgi:hypothetical protein